MGVHARLTTQPERSVGIAWWQKMYFFNSIDRITALLTCGFATDLLLVQLFYAGHFWYYAPLFLVGVAALTSMYIGQTWYLKYAETKDSNAIWMGYFYHTMWHLLACSMLTIQMYGL